MPGPSLNRAVDRIIDANINRLKEGLRVCEEITRFALNNRLLTAQLKALRHRIEFNLKDFGPEKIIASRQAGADIGKGILGRELERGGVEHIFRANIQRAKESLRVLEEFAKLSNVKLSLLLKDVRYRLYEIEKKALKKFASLPGL